MTRTNLILALVCLARAASAATPCGTDNLLAGRKPHSSSETHGDLALLTDGAVGAEGTQWDAPVVVKLDTSTAAVTYDLGEPRRISALLMQGDANDVYKVSGSLDDSTSSFKPLTEFPNAVNIGHGLRTRTVEIEPATVRFLRVGGATGDSFFSISELGAYCEKPSPFPPVMRVVEGTPQPGTGGGAPSDDAWRSFHLVFFVAALAFAWLALRTIKPARAKPDETSSRP